MPRALLFYIDGQPRYVPSWAPDRITSLAVLRFPDSKIVWLEDVPAGAQSWHPAVD